MRITTCCAVAVGLVAVAVPVPSAEAATVPVVVSGLSFVPAIANAQSGDTVTWTGLSFHSVIQINVLADCTSTTVGGFASVTSPPGGTFSYVIPSNFTGDLFYRCGPHGCCCGMRGTIHVTAPPPPPCPGDANGDRVIDFADVTAVFTNWATAGPAGDADHNGAVDFGDITAVFTNWGGACP